MFFIPCLFSAITLQCLKGLLQVWLAEKSAEGRREENTAVVPASMEDCLTAFNRILNFHIACEPEDFSENLFAYSFNQILELLFSVLLDPSGLIFEQPQKLDEEVFHAYFIVYSRLLNGV